MHYEQKDVANHCLQVFAGKAKWKNLFPRKRNVLGLWEYLTEKHNNNNNNNNNNLFSFSITIQAR